MDKALKQRLLGAAVVTALVVIVVPELIRDPAQPVQSQARVESAPAPRPVENDPTAESVVISLNREDSLRPPAAPLSQPEGTALPTPLVPPSLPQMPATVTTADTGTAADSQAPMAAVAMVETATEALQEPPAVSSFTNEDETEDEAPPSALSTARELAADPPPPVDDTRRLAAREAAAKLRSREISRNRAIAAERARLAEERRRATTLAEQRARATRQAQASREAQRPTARQASQRVVQRSPTREDSLPPVELIARSAPDASTGGNWAVQAGSFSEPRYANQLRDRLRSQRFPATVRQAQVDGRTLFRVQIGPQNRAASEQVLQRMRQEVGINGTVMPLGG